MSVQAVRVMFDSEIFSAQIRGGISRYFVELVTRLPTFGVEPSLVIPLCFNQHLAEHRPRSLRGLSLPLSVRSPWTAKAITYGLRVTDELMARAGSYDLCHHTFYGRRYPLRTPQVLTIVDMIPELFPHFFPGGNPHAMKATLLRSAKLLLSISEQTRTDLEALFPDLQADIVVTPLAVDSLHFQRHSAHVRPEDDLVLFVGQRGGYKNFAVFAQACAQLQARRLGLRLACVGGGPLDETELQPFVERGVAGRVFQIDATDLELPTWYRKATVFVFPSLYEGFGLPILEAFASACPVALANRSCFPEVADEAAVYFDPASTDSMASAIERVLDDSALRDRLRRLGGQRLANFSWDRTAQLTADAYRRVV